MKSSLHLSANDMTYGTSNCSLRCENKKSLVALIYVAQCFLVRLMVMTARVGRALRASAAQANTSVTQSKKLANT
jgi:hypothetical protein